MHCFALNDDLVTSALLESVSAFQMDILSGETISLLMCRKPLDS
jgi:hypothetical protein